MLVSRSRFARGEGDDDRSGSRIVVNVPFEFVGKVASARTVAEASDVESCAAAARHLVQALEAWSTAGERCAKMQRMWRLGFRELEDEGGEAVEEESKAGGNARRLCNGH